MQRLHTDWCGTCKQHLSVSSLPCLPSFPLLPYNSTGVLLVSHQGLTNSCISKVENQDGTQLSATQ